MMDADELWYEYFDSLSLDDYAEIWNREAVIEHLENNEVNNVEDDVIDKLLEFTKERHEEWEQEVVSELYDSIMDMINDYNLDDFAVISLFTKLAYQFSKNI